MSQQPSFATKLINELGFDDASILLYDLVLRKFNTDIPHILISQMEQFVREEFDAASQVSGYPQNFVKAVCPDSNWYTGAMGETARYPIDGSGGPQQKLLGIILPVINENPELGVKLRCQIVEMIYDDYQALSSIMNSIPGMPISFLDAGKRREFNARRQKAMELHNRYYGLRT